MLLRQIFDPYLAQYAYLIGCQRSGEALIIDPERDIEQYRSLAAENSLVIKAVAETHIHADFISGAREFSEDPEIRLYLSDEGGPDWTYQWSKEHSNTQLLKDGDYFMVGQIKVQALHTPGHTPEHLSFLITDLGSGANQPIALVTGDFLFVSDVGRPDLLESAAGIKNSMEPSAQILSESLRKKLIQLPDYIQILPAHGAGSACGKSLGAVPFSTLGYERLFNRPFNLALNNQADFVKEILRDQPNPPLYFANMKRLNRDGAKITNGVPLPTELTPEQFNKLAKEQHVVLDTREDRQAFDLEHFPRSLNAPLRSPLFSAAAGSFINEQDKILLLVADQASAELAARQLYRIGLDHSVGWLAVKSAQAAGLMSASIERIPFTEFDTKLASQTGTIIDVRTSGEFNHGHIEGALSFPYTRLAEQLEELPKKQTLFIHCGTGKRASLAASFLSSKGFEVVHVDGVCSECTK